VLTPNIVCDLSKFELAACPVACCSHFSENPAGDHSRTIILPFHFEDPEGEGEGGETRIPRPQNPEPAVS
jgi:hypothetical protein